MLKRIFFVSAIAVSFLLMAFTNGETGTKADGPSFVGVKTCGMCHKKDKDGNQLKVWEGTKHAKAYETLASDEAKKIAKEKGIDDPQKAEACLKCHASGYAEGAMVGKKFSVEDGVQCETCHGAGSEYKSMKTMKDHAKAVAAGMKDFSAEGAAEALCKTCHNEESPTFKGFNFAEKYKEISHMIPKG
jgi:hypothetical protein